MEETSEKKESLWLLAASPLVWAAHFLASYAVAAVWCAKFVGADESLAPVRLTIAALTTVGLAVVGGIGWRAARRHRRAGDLPHDQDSAEDRHGFLGFAVLLLSALSAVAILYSTMVIVFVRSCR